MIFIVGIAITIFLTFILFTKKGKNKADNILLVWLFIILAHLTMFALVSSQEHLQFPYLLGVDIPLPLLHGPALYLYTRALTNKKVTLKSLLPHAIPYTIAFISIIPFILQDSAHKILVYQNNGEGYDTLMAFVFLSVILSGLTYTILSLRLVMAHKKEIKDSYSYTEKINLEWLFKLIIGLSCIWILVFFASDYVIFSSVVLYVLLIGYFGIKQVGIFNNQLPSPIPYHAATIQQVIHEAPKEEKYEKSSLSDHQITIIHRALTQLMIEEKAHLIPELSLTDVAKKLDIHPNTLSQVINQVEQKNFFDYINSMRVDEFKQRAQQFDHQKYTLLSLALECGFNSKTSFNRNFKKINGTSPSEYLKQITKD